MKPLRLLPFLIFYLLIVWFAAPKELIGDEPGYVMHAGYLSQGFYSREGADQIQLWWGPGYPLILVPFILLKLPWLAARLLNALFIWGGLFYMHQTLRFYLPDKSAFRLALLAGIYLPFLRFIPYLYSESLAIFLMSAFIYYFVKLLRQKRRSIPLLLLASGLLACLTLAKVFFGYVILTMIVFLFVTWLIRRPFFVRPLLVFILALVMCTPYLIYTYRLTGKIFYWANSGGFSLYWISTPYPEELGDWFWWHDFEDHPRLAANHKPFFDKVLKQPIIKRDEMLKAAALENIRRHPKKYIKNWCANLGRLFFNYPYSYTPQKLSTYFYIVPNMFLLVAILFCLYPTYIGRHQIPAEMWLLLLFAGVSLGGTSLLSAYTRQFTALVPLLLPWIGFTLTRLVRIELPKQGFRGDEPG